MMVNYDMPWNPQRIEQRIGRCHRYGQKHDVVVVNFVNDSNIADNRVYELLNNKFNLFDGVFGYSYEILGAIDSGVGFEKRLNQIFQKCRTAEEIDAIWRQLRKEPNARIKLALKEQEVKLAKDLRQKQQIFFEMRDQCADQVDKLTERLRKSMAEAPLNTHCYSSSRGKSFNFPSNA